MQVYEAILQRRSIRKFKDVEVSDASIDLMLKAAMAAPTACNRRPWFFYVVKNKEVIARLKKASLFTNKNSSLIIVACGDTTRALPAKLSQFWVQDLSAAVENMLLTATAEGLGACWCGLYPMEAAQKKVQSILDTPKNHIPMALIHVGHPDEAHEPRTQYEDACVKVIK